MPSTYAHYRMGQEVRNAINGNEKVIVEKYLDLFNIGLHGPDIWHICMELYVILL